MGLNNYITPKIKEAFEKEHPHLAGKTSRKILRNMTKMYINSKKELRQDNGIRKSRAERRQLAKKLSVPFEPRYNGPIFKIIEVTNEDGNKVKEYKEVLQ